MKAVRYRTLIKNDMYNAFPSITRAADGRLVMVYRQAENSVKTYGKISHVDKSSCVAMVFSQDDGESWSDPEIIYNDEMGEQDPCVDCLDDGTLICTFFRWKVVPLEQKDELGEAYKHYGRVVFDKYAAVHIGTSCMFSTDNGESWSETRMIETPEFQGPAALSGNCIAVSDGSGVSDGLGGSDGSGGSGREGSGRILAPMFAVQRFGDLSSCFVMGSDDGGLSWNLVGRVPEVDGLHFLEPTIYKAPSGRLDMLMRTQRDFLKLPFNETYMVLHTSSSHDGGKTWSIPEPTELFCPNPIRTVIDGSGALLAFYGQRRDPKGIEGLLTDAESPVYADAGVTMLKEAESGDLGYPSAVLLRDGRVLIVYYITDPDGDACIGASWVEV